jgi:hypothetical protein
MSLFLREDDATKVKLHKLTYLLQVALEKPEFRSERVSHNLRVVKCCLTSEMYTIFGSVKNIKTPSIEDKFKLCIG